jgi:hypothetical protein
MAPSRFAKMAAALLASPALRFHPSTDTLRRCLSRELESTRLGLTEGWRPGLRAVMRQ